MKSEYMDDTEVETPVYVAFRGELETNLLQHEREFGLTLLFLTKLDVRALNEPWTSHGQSYISSRDQSLRAGLLAKGQVCRDMSAYIISLQNWPAGEWRF